MKKIIIFIILFIFTDCRGIIYRQEKIPGKLGNAKAIKEASVCMFNYLFIVSSGDASIKAAKEKGSISKISSVEIEVTSYFYYLVRKHCLILSGE
ncbi:MAG TPA: TRL domain-containing protein [Leptospiraceae bacterium]|nr:TRL domain-containing protein [Leptospiraceae bacterium]HNF14306.1 TRL domain-containing protein [Leptospiraceae bacterium]HNF23546.1 TRL domain-containing protein [Leptospiraceae bacterium]HNH07104.1 TRL domain-containing protein [Leptospiraceae bacterium]HNM02491.1 TRL domain-containing protein [Leptospiraceae bacterium]